MNAIISKAFVFINEVMSVVIIGLVLLVGLVAMFSWSFWAGLLIAIFGTVFVVLIFGFCSMIIENHKLLKEIRDSLAK